MTCCSVGIRLNFRSTGRPRYSQNSNLYVPWCSPLARLLIVWNRRRIDSSLLQHNISLQDADRSGTVSVACSPTKTTKGEH